MKKSLVIFETHPVQYHAPVYREVALQGISVTAVYGSDFSVAGYKDREFGTSFAWDTDLLSGYDSRFFRRVGDKKNQNPEVIDNTEFVKQIDELKPDAVLVCGYSSLFDKHAIQATLSRNIPIIFRAETTDHAKKRNLIKSFLRDWKLKRYYKSFSAVLSIGIRSREHYLRLGVPPEKIYPSPYCVSTTPFRMTESDRSELRQQTRESYKINQSDIVLLFSGKIVWRKGVDLLLPAIRKLDPEIRSRIVLAFLGDGELRQEIESNCQNNPKLSVRFFGFQNQSKLSDFYHLADLLVLPSRLGETWGLVVNDALYHGLPVITSDLVGCTSDLVVPGHTGEYFPSENIDEFAKAIQRAIQLVNRHEIREECRKKADDYSVVESAKGIVSAFRSLAK